MGLHQGDLVAGSHPAAAASLDDFDFSAQPSIDRQEGRRTLAGYLSGAPFSLERMTVTKESGPAIYRGERFHPGLGRDFEVTDSLESIARMTSHIPRKGLKQVIGCGSLMKAISVIERPSVIRRILEHLDLWVEELPRPPPAPLDVVCEPDADYVSWRDGVPDVDAG